MSVLAIVLIIVAALVVVLFAGGLVAARRRAAGSEAALGEQLRKVNEQLALAHAQDNGWDREIMEAAAREAFAATGGGPIESLALLQVVDRPGTDEDEAVFRIDAAGTSTELTLGRRDGAWIAR